LLDRKLAGHRLSRPTVGSVLACIACVSMLTLCSRPAEAAVVRSGTLQATVTDDFRDERSTIRYHLKSGTQRVPVAPTELAAEPGDRVTVTGAFRNGRLVGEVETTTAGAQAQAVAPGPRNVAVLLVTFAGEGGEPWPRAVARSEVFTGPNSVNAFYQEESYGEISLTGKLSENGDVFGWFGLDTPTSGCPSDEWKDEADQAAAADGVDLTGYQHILYEFPYQHSCSWLGKAALNGSWAMINGDFLGLGLRRQVTAHELGHNLGLWHAGSWTCTAGGVRVQISDDCAVAEYGDPFDTMGNKSFRHNSGWNLAKLGILSAENIETVEASGIYALRSALNSTTEPTVLRIPRTRLSNGNVSSWYYLEIRQTGGIFENVTDASTGGVSIRATATGSSAETLLLDVNPGTATFQDAPLGAGQTFDGGPVQIGTVSAGGGSATVSVELDEEPPSPPTDLAATAGAEEVQLEWSASDDNFDVDHYVVFRDGAEVGTAASTVFLDSPVSLGEHTYLVYAEDATGNRSAASEPATVTVVPDEEPPTAPTGLAATVGNNGVQLQWNASSDDFGVDRYFVYRDGLQIGSPKNPGFLDSIVSAGEHTYLVYAEDATGNRSDASDPATATVPAIAGPSCAAGTCTVVYRYSGAPAPWTAPPGVGTAEFTVEGAQGGTLLLETLFGRGARVIATLGALTPGTEATVSVGGAGERDDEGGAGGFNGGGNGTFGGGGGGFSSVELDSTLMLLAAGGGGDGRNGFNPATENEPNGGRGGRGGESGTPGSLGSSTEAHGATLDKGGGGAAGGSGGVGGSGGGVTGASICPGGAGAGAVGASGGSFAGGGGAPGAGAGGGGGYVGGGQGGGAAADECGSVAGSGGGGGGSSFAAGGLSPAFTGGIRRGDGEVSIAYANPIGAAAHNYVTEADLELVVPAGSGVLSGAGLPAGSLTASLAGEPAHGDLTLHADGSFAYAPASGYVGEDSFVYRAEDSFGHYATATVTLTVEMPLPEPEEPGPGPEAPVPGPQTPGPIVEPPAPLPTPLAVTIRSPRTRLAHRVAKVKLACSGGAPGSVCSGVLRLSATRALLGRRRYAVASGGTRWVAVRLRPAPLRRLWRWRRHAARVRATATAAGGRNARRAIVLRLGSGAPPPSYSRWCRIACSKVTKTVPPMR
jgi:hypothetical protein